MLLTLHLPGAHCPLMDTQHLLHYSVCISLMFKIVDTFSRHTNRQTDSTECTTQHAATTTSLCVCVCVGGWVAGRVGVYVNENP